MRYLNKIIFINSANISYAEIGVDGNVHFIGTQGVGKSTTLRAILFFYNADKLKLGIEKGKRSFDDYYFPYGNSYLIYEVVRETGPFCIMAFKTQGRAAFRFIDGPYKQENFISPENKAMTWDQVRNSISGSMGHSRKIERYEEYRDILYGNNKGLLAEFRKYALIESKQYQNLPRTIQNVFLNSKLEAEFIKQTIIMSLNEEDVKIDLDQYAFHLKDFEQQLADICKWSDKNRSGDVVVRLIATTIVKLYTEISFIEKERINVAHQLISNQATMEKSLPEILKQLEHEIEKLIIANKKVAEADQRFQVKRDKINKEITLLEGSLNEAKQRNEHYELLNIHKIIERVNKRSEWVNKRDGLKEENQLLTTRFTEITNKYEALILQTQKQLQDFVNLKNSEKYNLTESLYKIKENLQLQYDNIIGEIEKENIEIKGNVERVISEKKELIHEWELRKRETQLKRWFEEEIEECKRACREADQLILSANVEIAGSKTQIESLQKQWDLDLSKYEADYSNKTTNINDTIAANDLKIEQILLIINQRKDSLYDWLNENKPGWEKTIGKVVNQEHILFHSGLSPKIANLDSLQLYGVEIDLEELPINVKTIADYEKEFTELKEISKKAEESISALTEERIKELDKYKKKYQPQIKELKELISLKEYESQQAVLNSQKEALELEDWLRKATESQSNAIADIEKEIALTRNEKQIADEELHAINKNIKIHVDNKKKERDNKVAEENGVLQDRLKKLNIEIVNEEAATESRISKIKLKINQALDNEGADTVRISAIENELREIGKELDFIEDNTHYVFDYKKDKRELFDRIEEFKTNKKLAEAKLISEHQSHESDKIMLQSAVDKLKITIEGFEAKRNSMEEDLHEFNLFKETDVFSRLDLGSMVITEQFNTRKRLKELIADLNDKSFSLRNKIDELKAAVSKFLSHFSSTNIFGFKTNMIDNPDYFDFAENLREFLEEDKIAEFEKRTNEHFASLISQISKETTELVSKEAIIQKVIMEINKDFEERNFAGVIKSINLRLSPSANKIVMLLSEIRSFNNEHSSTLGTANLFTSTDTEQNNKKAVGYLKNFANEITASKQHEINLSDTFELQFRVVENDNDSGWVEKLTNVGSEGTDILVKAMINIMLLNVFKESASKRFKDFRLHCMMDEIGKLHPNNVKGILKFANDRNIVLVNSSPTSYNAKDYKHTYLLAKDNRNATRVKRLVTNN